MCEKIVAPCGIDCFNCEMYETNVTKEFMERLSASTGIPVEKITCKGCKDGNICSMLAFYEKKCSTLECVKERKVDYCFQCNDFPCEYLMPLADRADKFPQNMKLYNLCIMKKFGVEGYIERAGNIRSTYFTKKLQIGQGGK
jgi:hypothetical protein